jgi:hypothetical protein
MIKVQSCGNEGENIFVNRMVDDVSDEYMGCFQDDPKAPNMTFLGNSPTQQNSNNYDYDTCKKSAIQQGYKYFALQQVDPETGLGLCAVSNDEQSSIKLGTAYISNASISLWDSKTSGQPGNTMTLTNTGSLSVLNSSGSSIFSTPSASPLPSSYYGCYGDNPNRAMPLYNNGAQSYNFEQCQQIAQQNGSAYFGLQNSTSGENAQCALSSNLGQSTQYGVANNCTQTSSGVISGGAWSNAIYNTSQPQGNFFLILQDDGNMVVYRGTGPNDNQGAVWATGTNGKQQPIGNLPYVAVNGKYGQNWISSGSTLSAGDFVGSTTGNIALIMQSDGNLVLYTFNMVENCQKIKNNSMAGGVTANALYSLNKVGIPDNMMKLAYIDQNSEIHHYSNDNAKYTDKYTTYSNTNLFGNNISTGPEIVNTNINDCTNICNNNNECGGFVFQEQGSVCMLKGKVINFDNFNFDNGFSTYVRNMEPSNPPNGVSSKTSDVNSITFNNYIDGGELSNNYGLANIAQSQKDKLKMAQEKMNNVSEKLTQVNKMLNKNTYKVTEQSLTNTNKLNKYVGNLVKTNYTIENYNSNNNEDKIVEESQITVLQRNYNYIILSIVATGAVLLSINLLK